ncbi:hypothetical protein T11_8332 [Trichinella zimbabwensis]|uniref:Uncharacterized protein n=1 Tax=Trichinella zimbabwensis TaxID=268475 RepID=A0A0V1H319_9BILA|nr:hypothetical protein T11_8332 [Trichinella zimbabwensis]
MRQTDQSKKIERVVCVVKNVNILISTPTLRTTHKKQQSKKVQYVLRQCNHLTPTNTQSEAT